MPLLLPKQVFRPASSTPLALRSVQPVPHEDCCPLPAPPLSRPPGSGTRFCAVFQGQSKEGQRP
ncbi:hypothetical protein ELI43_37915 [Rhizobium leguminosarum]|nr:hypothetical protein ELI43_37915 [Rhizobium leguminosarum]